MWQADKEDLSWGGWGCWIKSEETREKSENWHEAEKDWFIGLMLIDFDDLDIWGYAIVNWSIEKYYEKWGEKVERFDSWITGLNFFK